MIPVRTPFFLPWLYPALVWRMPASEKNIYLTFDDGPVAGPTDFVLETLKQFNVQATFFCIGDNVRKYPLVFNSIIAGGHAVGNHTYHHLNGWKTDSDEYLKDVSSCSHEIGKHDVPVRLFRPPYGRITRKQITALNNYHVIMWDVLTKDYKSLQSPEVCLKNATRATRQGSIVVFHDSFKAEKNIRYVLPRYIEYFLQQGFAFKPISL
jgi:peptidoglycan-N-acetylglucosamine deacetylase